MSTRQQRREWQEFREHHGSNVHQFKEKWLAMFGREPTDDEYLQFRNKRKELTASLGRKARDVVTLSKDSTIMTVTRRYEWDMGHRLPNHEGKCRRLHGHRYAAEIDIQGHVQQSGPSSGMVIDFSALDKRIEECIGEWDHRTMLHEDDQIFDGRNTDVESFGVLWVNFVPTAENIALCILRRLREQELHAVRVKLFETPRCWATVYYSA